MTLILLGCCVLFVACERQGDAQAAQAVKATAETPSAGKEEAENVPSRGAAAKETTTDGITWLEFSNKLPEGLEVDGDVLDGLHWKDASGENILVFHKSVVGRAEPLLNGDHYRKADGNWDMVEDYRELARDCQGADLTMEPHLGGWSLTDLDNDGHAEMTFAWTVGCRTDMSPVTHKVLLIEEGEKYGLRGQTALRVDSEKFEGGEYDVGKRFDGADDAFLEHAESVWEKTVREK
jgi:hypothetical protein